MSAQIYTIMNDASVTSYSAQEERKKKKKKRGITTRSRSVFAVTDLVGCQFSGHLLTSTYDPSPISIPLLQVCYEHYAPLPQTSSQRLSDVGSRLLTTSAGRGSHDATCTANRIHYKKSRKTYTLLYFNWSGFEYWLSPHMTWESPCFSPAIHFPCPRWRSISV